MKDIPIAFIDDDNTIYESENYVNFKLQEKDKEIERLQHNQEVSTKWEIKLTQKNTKLKEENKKLNSIIKEVREYIKDYELYYDEELGLVEMMDAGSTRTPVIESTPLLEILDKVVENSK